jgi:hypothetical protein
MGGGGCSYSATTSYMGISPVIRVFPWGRPMELNCARPLGVPGCYITCRGCLSRYITALVPHVLTTSCSRTADIRAPACGQRQLGAYLAGRPFPGSQGQTGRRATGRTEPHYYADPGPLRWPCGTPVGDPTAARCGRRGMTACATRSRAPNEPPRNQHRAGLAALEVQKFVPFIWIFQTVWVPKWW